MPFKNKLERDKIIKNLYLKYYGALKSRGTISEIISVETGVAVSTVQGILFKMFGKSDCKVVVKHRHTKIISVYKKIKSKYTNKRALLIAVRNETGFGLRSIELVIRHFEGKKRKKSVKAEKKYLKLRCGVEYRDDIMGRIAKDQARKDTSSLTPGSVQLVRLKSRKTAAYYG